MKLKYFQPSFFATGYFHYHLNCGWFKPYYLLKSIVLLPASYHNFYKSMKELIDHQDGA